MNHPLGITPKYPRRTEVAAEVGPTPAHESFSSAHPCSVSMGAPSRVEALTRLANQTTDDADHATRLAEAAGLDTDGMTWDDVAEAAREQINEYLLALGRGRNTSRAYHIDPRSVNFSKDEIISSDWRIYSGRSMADPVPMNESPKTTAWYVMDAFAPTRKAAVVSGPFATREEAETDRLERNIADDCESMAFGFDPRKD